jgi:hypothetical protein
MPNEVADLIASAAIVYTAPLNTTLPSDTLALGAAWPAGWVAVGLTKEPLKSTYAPENLDFVVQQALAKVKSRKKSEKMTLETVLAELTPTTLDYAADGAVDSQASYEKITFGGDPSLTERMWGFEGEWINSAGTSLPVRLIVYKANSSGELELVADREDYTGVPLHIDASEDLTRTKGARLFYLIRVKVPA